MRQRALGLTLPIASSTFAATPVGSAPAAPAGPPVSHGPPIAGVCLLSVNQAIAQSTVGGYVRTRLDQIVAQVRAELNPEEAAINNDGKALEGLPRPPWIRRRCRAARRRSRPADQPRFSKGRTAAPGRSGRPTPGQGALQPDCPGAGADRPTALVSSIGRVTAAFWSTRPR